VNEEQINKHLKKEALKNPNANIIEIITTLLPAPLAYELCKLAGVKEDITLKKLSGKIKEKLIQILVWTPLTVNGHDGFKLAMITRGGVNG